MIKTVLDDTLKEAEQLFSQIAKAKCLCTVCRKEVRFLPPSPYKRVMREHYGYEGKDIDFLFEGEEDRCPVCGASENVRFLLGFLEDVQPEGSERLKICCVDAPDTGETGLQGWIRKYASIKEYMEYASIKDADEKMDVIICADILEQTEDDLKILEEIHQMLKDNGVCVVMVSAFYAGGSGLKESPIWEEPVLGHETESWKKFGLEGVRRIYEKEALISRLEEKGFDVNTADAEWFGKEYYEQCGFGAHAQLFMLTKR